MIKLAIIGTNWITDKFIAAALQSQQYQLVAVYSRSLDKGRLFAQKYHIDSVYTDLDELAKNPQIDAIYIASPNSLHFNQAKLMLENGKDVICEKPLTSNLKQTQALIEIAINHQQVLFEALKTYYLPNYQQIRNYLPKLGKIHKVLLNYCQYSSRYPSYLKGENPNTFNPLFSNGSIMDIGVYPLNFAIGLWGKPTTISATASLLESGVDGHGSVIMEYEDFEVIIWHSKVSNSYIPSEIQGQDGALIINQLSICQQVSYQPRQAELQDISVPQNSNDMFYEANHFAQLCQQRQIEHNGLSNSLTAAELLTTIRQQTGVIFPADQFDLP
ncbi:oxidoreductase [Gilliamella sp. wkB178]|uniref:Gfo/Idh/MocA family protein n=1 Tax=Gilliamella sp. wkB178 TaxID=3120259 RepID=UPI00080DB506|nr:Gfo/Idh/MocA family oxidoreductase [Gilliamella apicola]OCG09071.1 oxidoreductase [Gilliamella apicola]